MERTIFYSWQSDLSNNSNRGFISNCIKNSLKELKQLKPNSINIILDQATREETGSPDITESIFSKISNSSVFIADLSIVNNSNEKIRKTPNPNVLIELGYAARTLGWEKIICVFNIDYGDFSDLPFDLRNRRIMTYSLKDKDKQEVKKDLSKQIKNSIIEMQKKGILSDKLLDFLKKEIDQEILTLLSHLVRFIQKNNNSNNFFNEITEFINLEKKDIIEILGNKKIIGFYLLKSFETHEEKFNKFINQALASPYYNREILNALIDIYEWFSAYSDWWGKYSSNFFVKLQETEKELFTIHSSQISPNKYDKRFLLMKKIDGEKDKGIVHNFGDFYPGYIESLTNYYRLDKKYIDKYADTIMLLIKSINNWLSMTNNEIIIDFIKNFRVKKSDGEWL